MRRATLGAAVCVLSLSACADPAPKAGTDLRESPVVAASPTTTTPEASTTTESKPVTTSTTRDWGPVLCPSGPRQHDPCPKDRPAGGIWEALANCESGGDPSKTTGNGYYGAFQFSAATWRSVGETGVASDYPYSHQLAAAQRLQVRSGWGQWPACSAALGLI